MSATDQAADLYTIPFGEEGPLVVFFHGLFGQGRNFAPIAKHLGLNGFRTLLVDLPNHGRSPWTDQFSYPQMVEFVADWLQTSPQVAGHAPTLVGHSMGGKVAMATALTHPDLVDRLAVLDMSPVTYGDDHGVSEVGEAAQALDLATISSRGDASEQLYQRLPNRTIRQWMLTNLHQNGQQWQWRLNLDLLMDSLEAIKGWPRQYEELRAAGTRFDRPVLWVKGEQSSYILPEYEPVMRAYFPDTQRVTVKGAGHWVHSQKGAVVSQVLEHFLRRTQP